MNPSHGLPAYYSKHQINTSLNSVWHCVIALLIVRSITQTLQNPDVLRIIFMYNKIWQFRNLSLPPQLICSSSINVLWLWAFVRSVRSVTEHTRLSNKPCSLPTRGGTNPLIHIKRITTLTNYFIRLIKSISTLWDINHERAKRVAVANLVTNTTRLVRASIGRGVLLRTLVTRHRWWGFFNVLWWFRPRSINRIVGTMRSRVVLSRTLITRHTNWGFVYKSFSFFRLVVEP